MELKQIFNNWAHSVGEEYSKKQWLLSKWEMFEGVEWSEKKCAILIKNIRDRLQLSPEEKLIELGCGGGWILESLKPYVEKAYGMDIAVEMLKHAQGILPQNILLSGEIGKIPIKENFFDKILCYYVFINFSEDSYIEDSIREIGRVLKKGGRALIGQLPDRTKSSQYDRAKKDYLEHCQNIYQNNLGRDTSEIHLPPLKLYDKNKLISFLKKNDLRFHFSKSFNPFYYPRQPELIDWRFDIIIDKV